MNANDHYLKIETKLMKSSWDFLPEIPSSFKEKIRQLLRVVITLKIFLSKVTSVTSI